MTPLFFQQIGVVSDLIWLALLSILFQTRKFSHFFKKLLEKCIFLHYHIHQQQTTFKTHKPKRSML
nr:MAG TPA: hypothetical protein [Caudoviricetes sp.]